MPMIIQQKVPSLIIYIECVLLIYYHKMNPNQNVALHLTSRLQHTLLYDMWQCSCEWIFTFSPSIYTHGCAITNYGFTGPHFSRSTGFAERAEDVFLLKCIKLVSSCSALTHILHTSCVRKTRGRAGGLRFLFSFNINTNRCLKYRHFPKQLKSHTGK